MLTCNFINCRYFLFCYFYVIFSSIIYQSHIRDCILQINLAICGSSSEFVQGLCFVNLFVFSFLPTPNFNFSLPFSPSIF
jgi:hypothetical protein